MPMIAERGAKRLLLATAGAARGVLWGKGPRSHLYRTDVRLSRHRALVAVCGEAR
jgi:hypothetical protein